MVKISFCSNVPPIVAVLICGEPVTPPDKLVALRVTPVPEVVIDTAVPFNVEPVLAGAVMVTVEDESNAE
jgi:hypothetical protein